MKDWATEFGIWYSVVTDIRKQALEAFVESTLCQGRVVLSALGGDASFRRYFRFNNIIAVDSPPQTQKNQEFVAIDKALIKAGIRAPEILACDLNEGFLIEEDLGSTTFAEAAAGDARHSWYIKAVSLLPEIAKVDIKLPPFDDAFIKMEFWIFLEWLLDKALHLSLSKGERSMLEDTLHTLILCCRAQPQVAMHRDFHSRNLMVVGNDLAVIDFQDMVKGPITYDAASLICDCYVDLGEDLRDELTAESFDAFKNSSLIKDWSFDDFKIAFNMTSLQRHLKVLGIFNRLNLRDGKSGYLKDLPLVMKYCLDESMYAGLSDLHEFLKERVAPGVMSCVQ